MNPLVASSRQLSDQVDALRFPSVPYVYNPLVYARDRTRHTSSAGARRLRASCSCSA